MDQQAAESMTPVDQDLSERQESWTQDVTQMMAVVILAATLIITAGILIGVFKAAEMVAIYYLLAAILLAWWGTRRGGWRWTSYIPALLCFGLGVYTTAAHGLRSPALLYFPQAVMVAAMLRNSRFALYVSGASILAYAGIGLASQGLSIDAAGYILIFAIGVLSVALLQWYIEMRFRRSLQNQLDINAILQAEAKRRQQAENELREHERQLRRLAENTNDLVMEVDQHGVIGYASPSFKTILGFDPQALIGQNAFNLLDPGDYQRVSEAAVGAAEKHTAGLLQSQARCADGRIIPLEISGTPIYDAEGRHIGFIGNGRDISARVQAEKALQESEAKYRNIIDSLPVGMHIYQLEDDDRLILRGYNPAADRILGIDHSGLVGREIETAFPGLAGGDVPQSYRAVAVTGTAWQDRQIFYDEGKISGAYDVHAFRTIIGQVAVMFEDVSERVRSEEALRMTEEKFATAFMTSPDSININRLSDGLYLDCNQGFCKLMGYERSEVIGKTSLELNIWYDSADRQRLVRGLQEKGVMENLEARFQRKDGRIVVGLMSARVIVIRGEKCILSIARDITERIQAEIELRETHARLEKAYEETLVGWARALELRERETANHSQRVVAQTVAMASMMGFQGEALENIQRGAMLHDIGKVGVPDGILLKPGPLTEDEWVTMRQHVEFAREMLDSIEYLHACMDIPCYHHERWDGTGYPYGLKSEEIPIPARIFAVVDVYDALTHDRPYRPAWSGAETRRYLHEQSGKQFDPAVVELFLRLLGSGALGE